LFDTAGVVMRPALFAIFVGWGFMYSTSRAESAPKSTATVVVEIQTNDDRVLRGVVDDRTDGDSLWLRQEVDGIVMAAAIPWSDMAGTMLDGNEVSVAELKERAAQLASRGPYLILAETELPSSGVGNLTSGNVVAMAGLARAPRVRCVEITSLGLVNLDRDAEPDGLEICITAIGDDGLPIAVRGNLRATLSGERRRAETAGVEFSELGRWTQRVRSEDFVDGTATYQLPFRTVAPEWEFDLLPDAVLSITLGASGHGNFQAAAPLVMRPFNPLRDNLQQERGTRFLPHEAPGRPPLNGFGPEHGLWLHWTR
jgi:hypothetical protein